MVKIFKEYSDAKKSAVSIIRSNWQSSILTLLNSEKEGMFYNELLLESGLSPKTLSMLLKKMTNGLLVSKTVYREKPMRVKYKITKRGSAIVSSNCPMLFVGAESDKALGI